MFTESPNDLSSGHSSLLSKKKTLFIVKIHLVQSTCRQYSFACNHQKNKHFKKLNFSGKTESCLQQTKLRSHKTTTVKFIKENNGIQLNMMNEHMQVILEVKHVNSSKTTTTTLFKSERLEHITNSPKNFYLSATWPLYDVII